METLILARHALAWSNANGVVSSTPPGLGLTPEGARQAGSLGAALALDELDLGVSTELARTRETLEIVCAGRAIPCVVVPGLNEIEFGAFEGGAVVDYRAWARAALSTTPCPGRGESRAAAVGRYVEAYTELLGRPERVALVVGHALPIRYVLDAALGLPPAALMTPVEHAVPHRLSRSELERAVALLAGWARAPRFRAPSS